MDTRSATPLPAPQCPLCGGPNGCAAVATGRFDVPCWYSEQSFPPALLARLPPDARGKACAQAGAAAADGSIED
jgi:hypothetical protein